MNQQEKQLRLIIIISIAVLVVLGIIVTIVALLNNKNPYGESITIQNYDQKVKNLSQDYEDNISASLYKIVDLNTEADVNGAEVKDAFIREGSEVQNEVLKGQRYQGSFIVDIDSLKQSYNVQYAYSTRDGDSFIAGYPILLSCVQPDKVKYDGFDCKDLIETQSSTQQLDALVNFLPHSTLSYSLKADATGDEFVVHAKLNIPEVDLKGDAASRQQTVQLYKSLVTDYIRSNGFDPEKYTIEYNYTDDGQKIIEDDHSHGEDGE